MKRLSIILSGLLAVTSATVALPEAARATAQAPSSMSASTSPSVSWFFTQPDVMSTDQPALTYTVSGNTSGSKVIVQRAVGTDSVWQNVKRLPTSGGYATVPAVPMGQHSYRIVIKQGTTIVAAKRQTLRSYGEVSVAKLIKLDSTSEAYVESGTVDADNGLFNYEWDGGTGFSSGQFINFLTLSRSSCSSLTVPVVAHFGYNDAPPTVQVRALLSAADSQTIEFPADSVGTITQRVKIGTSVRFAYKADDNATFYGAGTATCYTANGRTAK